MVVTLKNQNDFTKLQIGTHLKRRGCLNFPVNAYDDHTLNVHVHEHSPKTGPRLQSFCRNRRNRLVPGLQSNPDTRHCNFAKPSGKATKKILTIAPKTLKINHKMSFYAPRSKKYLHPQLWPPGDRADRAARSHHRISLQRRRKAAQSWQPHGPNHGLHPHQPHQ